MLLYKKLLLMTFGTTLVFAYILATKLQFTNHIFDKGEPSLILALQLQSRINHHHLLSSFLINNTTRPLSITYIKADVCTQATENNTNSCQLVPEEARCFGVMARCISVCQLCVYAIF